MNVLVTGGRDFADDAFLARILEPYRRATIIHGAAPGADMLAYRWAKRVGARQRAFPAAWEAHGKAAGPMRNQRMLEEGKPDLVIAFPRANGKWGQGTSDMMRRARAAGVEVLQFDPRSEAHG